MFKQILHVLGSSTAQDGEGEGSAPLTAGIGGCTACAVPLPSLLPAGGHGEVWSLQRPLVEQQFKISICVLKKGKKRSTLGEEHCVPCKLSAPAC